MDAVDRLIAEMVRQRRVGSVEQGRRHLERVFEDLPLDGASVLEIGSGRGELSLFAACRGARRVVGLEPEDAGSTSSTLADFRRMARRLDLQQVEALPLRFQDYDSAGARFDIVLSYASINHLDEDACRDLQHSTTARATYLELFRKLNGLVEPGGTLIVTDASRYNFFGMLGLRNPFDPSINWKLHQSPRFWCRLLERCGFRQVDVTWFQPRPLDRLGPLTRNELVSFFVISRFKLVMQNTGAAN